MMALKASVENMDSLSGSMDARPSLAFDDFIYSLQQANEAMNSFNGRMSNLHVRMFGPQPQNPECEPDAPEPMGALPTVQRLLSDIENQMYRMNKHIEKLEGIV